tara:strand:+ start:293 stop:1270 length:978 start_codon:yes stop_codon:yes gene_type:complete
MLIDVMGDDQSVVAGAKISYGLTSSQHQLEKEGGWWKCRVCGDLFNTEKPPKPARVCDVQDRNVIRYMLKHHHGSPSEFPVFRMRVRLPMDAQRQFVRHRIASLNEFSTRYSNVAEHEMPVRKIASDEWRLQSKSNKQGSSGDVVTGYQEGVPVVAVRNVPIPQSTLTAGEYLSARQGDLHDHVREVYDERIAFGVAKELARTDLVLSQYTDCIYQFNWRSLMNFLWLRTDPHAQWEIRQYADVIEQMVADWLPVSYEAWVDYQKEAHTFSRMEMNLIRELMEHVHGGTFGLLTKDRWTSWVKESAPEMSQRERREFRLALGVEF